MANVCQQVLNHPVLTHRFLLYLYLFLGYVMNQFNDQLPVGLPAVVNNIG